MSRLLACSSLLVVALAPSGCSRKPQGETSKATTASAGGSLPPIAPKTNRPVSLDAISRLDECTLGHRGILLDFGDPSMHGHYAGKLDAPDPESVEHEGATWARATARSIAATFYWSGEIEHPPAPPGDAGASSDSGAYVEARIRGVTARTVAVYLNGKIVGSKSLKREETQVVLLRGGPGAIVAGPNEISLHFAGGSRGEGDVLAEVDWVHVASGDAGEPYSAPTRADALVSATVDGVSKRALSLRAPGFVRCAGWLPRGGTVEASLAMAGPGEGDAEVRLLRDRALPVVLGNAHVSGGPGAKWVNVSVPLGEVGAGTLGAIELAPLRTTARGARILFGEPRVLGPPVPSSVVPRMPSRGVVVVVMSGVATKSLAPYGGQRSVTELSSLAGRGVLFEAHRATTSIASGSLASMLTGLSPRAHTIEDADARLPKSLTTIADAARQAGVTTAMFTANPTTGPAFGFDRGWDTYAAQPPNEDAPGTQIFDTAARWIEAHKDARFLVVVHARGGHPPWDVTTEEMKSLAPPNYQGSFDPRRAAESLTKAKKYPHHFTEADRARVWALYANAIESHDVALGRLLASVRSAGRDVDTTIIVTGDAAVNEAAPIPFVDADALDESVLSIPLVIQSPVGFLAGTRVAAPTSATDLARTVMGALALTPPASFRGIDLIQIASGETPLSEPAMVATSASRFAVKWGPFVLAGSRERETKFCDLVLESTCHTDVRKTYPLALDAIHRFTFDAVGPTSNARIGREPAFIDPATMASLIAWGRPVERKKRGED